MSVLGSDLRFTSTLVSSVPSTLSPKPDEVAKEAHLDASKLVFDEPAQEAPVEITRQTSTNLHSWITSDRVSIQTKCLL